MMGIASVLPADSIDLPLTGLPSESCQLGRSSGSRRAPRVPPLRIGWTGTFPHPGSSIRGEGEGGGLMMIHEG